MKPTTASRRSRWLGSLPIVLALFVASPTGSPQPVLANDKVSDAVLERTRSNQQEPVDAIVSYHSRPGQMERSRIRALGGEIGRQFKAIDAISVKLPAAVVEELAAEPSVAWISLDAAIHSAAKGGKKAAGDSDATTCNSYWYEADFTGYGVTVAVVDSGILAEHPDLEGQILAAENFVTETSSNNNGTTRKQDIWGHGTHVAGIVAGRGLKSISR